jgi:hypothetical protein
MDAAVDTPVSVRFEALYHVFENARFIYTTRDVESWARSVKKFFGVEKPKDLRKHWRGEKYWNGGRKVGTGWEMKNAIQYRTIQEGLYSKYETWEEAYWGFDQRFQNFFKDKPEKKY